MKIYKTNKSSFALVTAVWLIFSFTLYAESARKLVARGNQAYSQGHFDEAMSAYNAAEKKCPDSEYILFNKGTVYYQQGNYTNAISLFERVSAMTDNPQLRAKSIYNKGNSYFREAEELKSVDPEASLERCENSIRSYQEALQINPSMKESAENLEIARIFKKAILEELRRQQLQYPQSHTGTNLTQQLQNITQKQQQILNQTLSKAESSTAQSQSEDGKELSREQKELREQLEKLIQQMKAEQDKEQLKEAVEHQKEAEKQLENKEWQNATTSEQKALEKLKEMQDKLTDNRTQYVKQNREEDKDKKKEQGNMQLPQQPPQNNISPENHQMFSQELSELRDILEDEKKYREMQKNFSAKYKPVDKDW